MSAPHRAILIGVDATDRSEDAIAFGRALAAAGGVSVIVASAYQGDGTQREYAATTASDMRAAAALNAPAGVRVVADPSPARALQELAHAERAALIVVGSTHTGRAGRVLPGSTGERLLNGSPCSVAVVPRDYRTRADAPIRRIGVAYDGTEEATAAAKAAIALARGLGAELELIGVVAPETYATAGIIGAATLPSLHEEIVQAVKDDLEGLAAELPQDIAVTTTCRNGVPATVLEERSAELDLLVMGSRGYGPLHAVLVGGVSGRVLRSAHCPVIVVPRGIEAPLEQLFDSVTAG